MNLRRMFNGLMIIVLSLPVLLTGSPAMARVAEPLNALKIAGGTDVPLARITEGNTIAEASWELQAVDSNLIIGKNRPPDWDIRPLLLDPENDVELTAYRTPTMRMFQQIDGTIYALVTTESFNQNLLSPQEDVKPSNDCYVSSWNSNTCQCEQTHIYVGYNDYYSKGKTRSYIRFDPLPTKPGSNYEVQSAELLMYFYAWQGTDSFQTNIYRVTGSWSCPTWSNQPPVDSTIRGSAIIPKVEQWNSWGITGLVQDWYDSTANYGLRVQAANENQYGGTFRAKENGSNAPILRVVFYQPTYTISGQVLDSGNNPIAGVDISDGAGHIVTTDASGNYTFSDLPGNTYTLTPSKDGYTFDPSSRNVTVPPDATSQDFTAQPACESPMIGVTISGPTSGETDEDLIFVAIPQPSDATTPIVYTWSSDGLVGGQDTDTATYNWSSAGEKTVQVTARNCGEQDFSNSYIVTINEPVPVTPILNDISNADGDGDYIVDWSDVTGADTYILEESDNADFTNPSTVYAGSDSEYTVSGQDGGIWYYRVKASGVAGDSDWSNTESVTVQATTEDAYEPDDTCAEASAISTDGTVQQHTFHDQGDADWVTFSAIAGITYTIQGSNVEDRVDLVHEIHSACDQPTIPSDDIDFGQGFRVIWECPTSGDYYLKVANHDASVYGENTAYDLSIREQTGGGVAIVVAGHRDVPENLMPNFTYAANMAYRTFRANGFDDEHIYYLHPEPSTNVDVDAASNSANLEDAITTWAAGYVGPNTPLYLYVVDHGSDDLFYIDTWEDTVSAADLDGWLTMLEDSTECDEINVIIETCESGSFIIPPDTLSSSGRVIISASKADQTAYGPGDGQGAYFSNTFLAQLGNGADLWTAYEVAGNALWEMRRQINHQQPWLDDNGDGVSNAQDGDIARQRGLLASFGSAAPWIAEVSAPQQASGYTAEITATIYDDGELEEVWAEIYPPSYQPPDDPDSVQVIDVPQARLSWVEEGVYSGSYGGFTEVGEYQIVIYARDDDHSQAVPRMTKVQTGWNVYLPLVLRAHR